MERQKILQKVLDCIWEEAEVEPDEYQDYAVIRSSFELGNVSVWFYSSHNQTTLELVNNKYPNREYENVTICLEGHLQRDEVLEMASDKLQEAYEDEWQSHGFRDAQDYWNYRLG